MPKDLASADHWTQRYSAAVVPTQWAPLDYNSLVIDYCIRRALKGRVPASVLEIGCGNSTWLPYLGRQLNVPVTGIDYSALGCEQAEAQLASAGVNGRIVCDDLFKIDPDSLGTFDFIYSLGFVEHFTDLPEVVRQVAALLSARGVMLSIVPNLRSVHGLLSWLYQPTVLAKHEVLSPRKLAEAHAHLGFVETETGYAGLASFNVVAWGVEPRWPRADRILRPLAVQGVRVSDAVLRRLGGLGAGNFPLSPFIYSIARRER
jgi:2-polyprenyl-6-hydroxyphenyl methylase/3-demethylubiquinone-9 3-methyltransferase